MSARPGDPDLLPLPWLRAGGWPSPRDQAGTLGSTPTLLPLSALGKIVAGKSVSTVQAVPFSSPRSNPTGSARGLGQAGWARRGPPSNTHASSGVWEWCPPSPGSGSGRRLPGARGGAGDLLFKHSLKRNVSKTC